MRLEASYRFPQPLAQTSPLAEPVHVVDLHPEPFEQPLLCTLEAAYAHQDQILGRQRALEAVHRCEHRVQGPEKGGHGHSVEVAGRRRGEVVGIHVGVYPDQPEPLGAAQGLDHPAPDSHGAGVVASQEQESALPLRELPDSVVDAAAQILQAVQVRQSRPQMQNALPLQPQAEGFETGMGRRGVSQSYRCLCASAFLSGEAGSGSDGVDVCHVPCRENRRRRRSSSPSPVWERAGERAIVTKCSMDGTTMFSLSRLGEGRGEGPLPDTRVPDA
ncbi:MAG: hypothetical protein U9Q81_10180, partial [Pseudomonadota bacterium]|nr:hypothetical protein [Pseudomonadota bacterium]